MSIVRHLGRPEKQVDRLRPCMSVASRPRARREIKGSPRRRSIPAGFVAPPRNTGGIPSSSRLASGAPRRRSDPFISGRTLTSALPRSKYVEYSSVGRLRGHSRSNSTFTAVPVDLFFRAPLARPLGEPTP